VNPLRLAGSEDKRARIVRRIVGHFGPIRHADDFGPRKIPKDSHVIGRGRNGGGWDLVELFQRHALPGRFGRAKQEGFDVRFRRTGRVTAVEVGGAGVRHEVRFRAALDRPQAHGDFMEYVPRVAVRFDPREEAHHPIHGVVSEMR